MSATARTAGIVTEWSPPSTTGMAPPSSTWAISPCARSKVFAGLPTIVRQSPVSTSPSDSWMSKSQVAL